MPADPVAERARRHVAALSRRGLDAASLLRGLADATRPVIAHDAAMWATVDPATLLVTGAHTEGLPAETAPAFYENEYGHGDVMPFSRLARGLRPVATLAEVTGGDLGRSRLHRELGPVSGLRGDVLRAAFVTGRCCWGVAALVRRDHRRPFGQADLAYMASIGTAAAEGLRAAVLLRALAGGARPVEDMPPTGLVVLDGHDIHALGGEAGAWLDELGDGRRTPSALLAVAAAADTGDGAPTRAVVRTPRGTWLSLQGLRLTSGAGDGRRAVIMSLARPPELAPVVLAAHGLSPREREVARQIVSGASTAEACAALHISPYTLQDHLTAIFDKVGVRSRGELTTAVLHRYVAHGPRPGSGR